jgi:protein-tyrosine phosphatase
MCLLNFVLFFRINYKCSFGESLYVVGNIDALGNWNSARALKLDWCDGHNWSKIIKVMHDNTKIIEYKYIVGTSDTNHSLQNIRWEAGPNRCIDLFSTSNLQIKLNDEWEQQKIKLALHHEAIKDLISSEKRVILCTNLDHIKSVQELKLKKHTLDAGTKEEWFWTATLRVPNHISSFYYKFKVVGKSAGEVISDRCYRKFSTKKFPSSEGAHHLNVLKCSSMVKFDFNFNTALSYNYVTDDILVGAFPQSLKDVNELAALGVKGVLNLQTFGDMLRYGEDWDFLKKSYKEANITVKHLPILDMNVGELKMKIQDATDLLHELLKEGKVYVHCTAGRHRSPHVIISYLCCYRDYGLKQAMCLVQSKRSKVKVFEGVFLKKRLEENISRV